MKTAAENVPRRVIKRIELHQRLHQHDNTKTRQVPPLIILSGTKGITMIRSFEPSGVSTLAAATVSTAAAAANELPGPIGILVLLGSPCSGKGTQCKKLAAYTGAIHLSTGDIFRDAVTRGTELGARVQGHLQRNEFVPDALVTDFILERLSHPDVVTNGCLLDGFPRTADQAKALMQAHGARVRVLMLEVPERVAINRAAGRQCDADTGAIYHRDFLPPPAGAKLVVRDMDGDRAAFRRRQDVFKHQLRRVIPCLPPVKKIAGVQEIDEVQQAILRELKESELAAAAPASESPEPQALCVICCDQPANFLVAPCGHQCGCESCLKKVVETHGSCPICRSRIDALQRVFRVGGSDDASTTGTKSRASTIVGPLHADVDDLDEDAWPDFDVDDSEEEETEVESAMQIQMSASLDRDLSCNQSDAARVNVCVHIEVPEAVKREPVDIACVIDTSGSMDCMVTREGENGEQIEDGLSILDIVKHAVKTVINILEDGDRLTLVGFSDFASIELPLQAMNEAGRRAAMTALEGMHAHDCTNIWAGVHAAMESLREPQGEKDDGTRRKAILLLTDGMPNCKPPRGEVAELKTYFEQHPTFASALQLSSFGFGYNLDSKLLLELAEAAKGTTAFIPDAVICGTVFVNAVANILSVHTQAPSLHLTATGGAEFAGLCAGDGSTEGGKRKKRGKKGELGGKGAVLGGFPVVETPWGLVVELGPLQFGQARDVVIPLKLPPQASGEERSSYLTASLTSTDAGSGAQILLSTLEASERSKSMTAVLGTLRALAVSVARVCVEEGERGNGQKACRMMEHMVKQFGPEPEVQALKSDVAGRMSKALLGQTRFKRWGRHYLRAILRAHQLQVCTNFMDAGIQAYGGQLFSQLRSQGDAVFLALPPPVPAPRPAREQRATASTTSPRAAAAPDMSSYYAGAGGGCFRADALVRRLLPTSAAHALAEPFEPGLAQDPRVSEEIRIADVKLGDRLLCSAGWSSVRCLVQIARCPSKPMVALSSGLVITPRHPVRVGGQWQQPRGLAGAEMCPGVDNVYNVLLDSDHVLMVAGVECITWGHRFTTPDIAHAFFGSAQVEQALAGMEGFEQGFVRVEGCIRAGAGDAPPVVQLVGAKAVRPSANPCNAVHGA